MVKFELDSSNYSFTADAGNSNIILKFKDSFKANLKFVKIDGNFIKTGEVTGDLSFSNGSLVQMGYTDGGKLVISEPVWVEIQDSTLLGKSVNVIHSI